MVSSNKRKSKKKVTPSAAKASHYGNHEVSGEVEKPKENGEEVAKPKDIVSNNKKLLKRKLITEIDKKLTTKSKAKKKKIDLEVPSLKSFIPGKVFVVGENTCGQIGLDIDDVDSKEKPFLLNLPSSVIDIAAGAMQSACLTEKGEVFTFGCNDEGTLGRLTPESEDFNPKKVEIPEKIVQISAGDSHTAGLAESGQVYLWGNFRNCEGQMGLTPDGQKRIIPIKVLTNEKIVKIASGVDHFVCLSSEGVVYTCGCAESGQLGRVNHRSCKDGGRQKGLATLLEPGAVNLKPKQPIHDIWTESYGTFLKTQETGSIYAFGLNNYNQLGLRNKKEDLVHFFPKSVSTFKDQSWQQICGGQHHTIALDSNGLVHALGRKEYGRLGLGQDCEDTPVPTAIPTLDKEKCINISCGNCVSYAVTQEGSLYSWGMASSQLGHGSATNSDDIHQPRLIKGDLLNSWYTIKVSGGGQHTLILARPKQGSSKNQTA